jgi:glycosyltransferase involved in cell wall biosynthesis
VRFLIITQYYPPEVGAAQLRLAAVARELRRAGHEVEVVTALPNYPSGRFIASDRGRTWRREVIDNVQATRVWLYPAKGTGVRRLASYLSFSATALVAALTVRRPDVVFVESPPLFLGATGWLVAKRFRSAFVLNVSDMWPDSVRALGVMRTGPWLRLAEGLEAWLYRHSSAVTAVTEGIRERLIERKGVPRSRVLVLPNGVDTEMLRLPAAGDEKPQARPFFLFAGNHGYAQGLDVVLDAAKLARDIDFVLVGDGSDKARLQERAWAEGITNVQFRPAVPATSIPALYASATAGIASLLRSELMADARPAKLLAIMSCSRPVLYSGEGEGAELVRAADAGIVVRPQDPAALAEAATLLAENPGRAKVMGENGRAYVSRHLSWASLVGAWLDELDDALHIGSQT